MTTGRVSGGKPVDPCGKCPLGLMGEGFVRGDGPGDARILVVGEAPGEAEAREGKPFVGPAGRMLDRLFQRAGLDRAGMRVANTVCCRPPKNFLAGAHYEFAAIDACRGLLEEEIARVKPQVIVALGNIAMRRLTGRSGITRFRGFPVKHASGAWVMPTYHPSFLLPRKGQKENAKLMGIVMLDLRRAVDIATHGFTAEDPATLPYVLDPPPDVAAIWATEFDNALSRGAARLLSWDIETPGKLKATSGEEDMDEEEDGEFGSTQILRISFAWAPGRAMSIPWRPDYMPTIRRLLEDPRVEHVTWNGYAFDIPVVALNGVAVRGVVHDGMWAWHILQSDLPRGLEAVASVYAPELGAWKHLSSAQPALYNAIDADAALRIFIGLEKDLKEKFQWELYSRHVQQLHPILFQAGRVNGICVDRFAQGELKEALETRRDELLKAAQTMVPAELRRVKVYTRIPKGADEREFTPIPGEKAIKKCLTCGKEGVTTVHLRKCPGAFLANAVKPVTVWKWTPDFSARSGEALLEAVATAGFNPGAAPQMMAYARLMGHRIGENWKTGRATFDKKVRAGLMKKFGRAHPIYALSQELSEITKTYGTYVVGFQPDSKGRVYTTYSFAPSSGRLSSRNVNLQNVTAHSKNPFARAVRKTLVPRVGHCFVEADSSAIEAVMSGFFMGDPEYIRLARQGVHDYVTCLELGWEFAPEKLGEYKQDPAYKAARERNKRVVHGTNYGMSPRMMMMQFPDHFPSESTAIRAQSRYFDACPKLGPWQHSVRVSAHKQTYLQNPWGYRHYFYQVFAKNERGEVVNGPDAKRAVSFLPQSSAAAFMRDSLLLLAEGPFAEFLPGNLSIHDSICLDVPVERREEAVEYLATLLTRPIPQMDGLRIGAEVKTGMNWGEMEVVRVERV